MLRGWAVCLPGAALLAALLLLRAEPVGAQQPNFAPLEPGDYTEIEERVIIARGLEVSADYAFRLRVDDHAFLPNARKGTHLDQDLRLKLDTLFNRDVRLHLTLELLPEGFDTTTLREAPRTENGVAEGLPLNLNVREAYLRYEFNPRSGLILGKQELSLADRRGKVFQGIVPAVTLDCRVGTWCMPFGLAKVGPLGADSIVHFALQYTAWDHPVSERRDRLQVEVGRLRYDEDNVPLGRNLGPGHYNPATSAAGTRPPHPSQLLDGGDAVYYNATDQNYYSLRVTWEGGPLFANFDGVGLRGLRHYHLLDQSNLDATGTALHPASLRGTALEAEFGYRWATGRLGLRAMSATGDDYRAYGNGQVYARDLVGFYEITPGSYTGTRLWFNGANTDPTQGAGLGHSINNTRLVGLFLDYRAPEGRKLSYSGGIYDLSFNRPVLDADGVSRDKIGVEVDNLITWHVHKELDFQFELNGILADSGFRLTEHADPNPRVASYYQLVTRVVYRF